LQRPRTEDEQRAEIITGYLEKYAAIANRALTPQVYAVYIEALADLEPRRIEKGMKTYLQAGTEGWPWPGKIREFIEEEI
jgi:hypothetical protein